MAGYLTVNHRCLKDLFLRFVLTGKRPWYASALGASTLWQMPMPLVFLPFFHKVNPFLCNCLFPSLYFLTFFRVVFGNDIDYMVGGLVVFLATSWWYFLADHWKGQIRYAKLSQCFLRITEMKWIVIILYT